MEWFESELEWKSSKDKDKRPAKIMVEIVFAVDLQTNEKTKKNQQTFE